MNKKSIYQIIDEFNKMRTNREEQILIAQKISRYLQSFVFSSGENRVPTENQKEKFVKAFSEQYRKVVKVLIDSTVSINTLDIISHFRTCLGLLPKDRPYVLYCPILDTHDSLKSVMFFELYLLHEAMTKYGLNIIYIFYGAFDRRPRNNVEESEERRPVSIIRLQKKELKEIKDFDAIYMDDISYSGTQFLMNTKQLFSIIKNKMFVFFYAMLPKSLERTFLYLIENKQKIKNIENLITIYTHKIIVDPFYILKKIRIHQDPLEITNIINYMCFKPEESGHPLQNMLYFVIDANMDADFNRFISMQDWLVRLQLESIHSRLQNTLKIFTKNDLNVAVEILKLYDNEPMVVTNYKIPDRQSLSPLYFGIIHEKLKNASASLDMVKNAEGKKVYSFPMWTESGKTKIRNQNFKQPWYKNIPITKIPLQ